ncbi:MAG: helix-turn-helix domain-containing protein [Dehalococcoidia bacterium]|nr:helix-turn-helix domain-containing protein [Dehalococcoidia bacterium]
MCGQIIFIALDFYTIPYIIDLMKQRKRRQWDKESIRILRRHLGATQRKLAEELGTRQQTISEWEIGMYRPRGTSATLLSIIAERSGFNYRLEEEDEEH